MSGCRKVRGEGKSVSMILRGIPVGLRSEKIVPRVSFSAEEDREHRVDSLGVRSLLRLKLLNGVDHVFESLIPLFRNYREILINF